MYLWVGVCEMWVDGRLQREQQKTERMAMARTASPNYDQDKGNIDTGADEWMDACMFVCVCMCDNKANMN